MKKNKILAFGLVGLLGLTACSSGNGDTLKGEGKGYGGKVSVEVTMDGENIKKVVAKGENETPNIGGAALDKMAEKIVKANSPDVQVVSGATATSKAVIYAVKNAMDPEKYPSANKEKEEKEPEKVSASKVYQGFGLSNIGRLGPGKDDKDIGVYSTNQVMADVLFDNEGKILAIHVDELEVATPNYDGEGMPQLTGFPGQSYNIDENHDGKIDGNKKSTEDGFLKEVIQWDTKRQRGASYRLGTGNWAEQMDKYQEIFVGKKVEEVEEWFNKYTSETTGKPLQEMSEDEKDKAKYDSLSEEEKEMLADVTSGAAMSLKDAHGDIIAAIKNAYDHKVALELEMASGMGLGFSFRGRTGPGKDNKDVGVYSINQVFANTLFDEEGKILSIYVDQMELATPNYDGEGMPQLTGFPDQSYNIDENHDGEIDGTNEATEEGFLKEVSEWKTKRQRGETYRLGSGTWAEEMDKFQELFIGKTVEEVEEWFEKYTSDETGKPLQEMTDNKNDKAKYEALSDDEKEMLADVTSSATMSLNDPHGDIISAIKSSFENVEKIDLSVE